MTGPQQPGDWHLHDHSLQRPTEHQAPNSGAAGPDWNPPTADQLVPGRRPLTSRGRSWLLLLVAGCLVLMYVVIWGQYAVTHMSDRYVQLAPGQPSELTVANTQFRVHKLARTDKIDDPSQPDEPAVPTPGTTFVVAEIEVLRVAESDVFGCQAKLAVEGVRQIELASVYTDDKDLPTTCYSDEVKVGEPYRFLAIYEVPLQYADQIYGIAVDYTDYGAPFQVIRPPA